MTIKYNAITHNRRFQRFFYWNLPGLSECGLDYTSHFDEQFVVINSKDGDDNRLWKTKIARGESASTGFRGVLHKVRYSDGSIDINFLAPSVGCTGKRFFATGPFFFMVPYQGIHMSSAREVAFVRAQASFISRATGVLKPLQIGATLIELRQTIAMIKHPLHALRKKASALERRLRSPPKKLKTLKSKRKWVSATYLEGTFGWQPLFGDISNGLQALQEYQSEHPFDIIRIRAKGGEECRGSEFVSERSLATGVVIYSKAQVVDRASYRLEAGAKVATDGANLDWRNLIGLTLPDYVPTLYEVLPYSWLADYFLNIGSILDAWSLVNTSWSFTNITCRMTSTFDVSKQWYDAAGVDSLGQVDTVRFVPSTSESYYKVVERNLEQFRLVPEFRMKLPTFGSVKSLNIVALLAQKR